MRRRKLIIEAQRREAIEADEVESDHSEAELFENGGWPPQDEAIREALVEAFESGAWGQYHGPYVESLEQQLASFHGVDHALTCSSGTIAVEIALRAVKVTPEDEVILAGYDFAGNFRAIEAIGARPVLVDLAPDSWCLDPQQMVAAIGPRTKGVVVSHLHSSLAEIHEIAKLAQQHQIAVIEDACQAQGAMVDGHIAGTTGNVGVWSFGGSKVLTAGRGGAIFTNDDGIHQRAKVYCERGNHAFALSELQAAVLLPQLETLPQRNLRRQANAAVMLAELADVPGLRSVANDSPRSQPAYYKASWFYQPSRNGPNREAVATATRAAGISFDAGFRGFISRPASRCRKVGELAHARRAIEETLLLHHPILLASEKEVSRAAQTIRRAILS